MWKDREDGTYREKRKGRKIAMKNEGQKVKTEYVIFLFITAALMKIHVFWYVQDVRVTSYLRRFAFDYYLPWLRR
jgi:hypothetical protein